MNQTSMPALGAAERQKLSLMEIAAMKRRRERIAMVTAYDAPSARLADLSGVELVLVGDSAAMTLLGHESTIPVTVDEMLMLTRAVTRGARRPVVVADLPFGSFQVSDEAAIAHAVRFIKEGAADAVKLEGAGRMLSRVRAILDAGVPVMGHIGLTPQSAMLLGGLKAQGRTARAAYQFVQDALALEHAGCFAVVVEAVPPPVAERITEALTIPTIGIGAGASCDGQVLVWHDLLGITAARVPKFVKRYADLAGTIRTALEAYVADVRSGKFPDAQHTYSMPDDERELFESALAAQGPGRGTSGTKG